VVYAINVIDRIMDDIDQLRKEIDRIDTLLMELINERARVSKRIGGIKSQQNIPVKQNPREKVVIENVKGLATDISPNNAEIIWKEIMSACRQVQGEQIKVAYLGPEGTFTQKAALAFFPKASTTFIPIERKHEIFQQVEGKYANFGIVPVENSIQGSVSDTLDLLIERNLKIYGEIEIRIIHNLIGLPGTKLSQLKTVYSHPIAISQVSEWIKKNIPQVDFIETVSTASAVRKVAELNDPTMAAIGADITAELYGLSILAEGVEDNTANYTRFLVIANKSPEPTGADKTSMVFVTKHIPGALFNILKIFADAKINLAKIESRPRKFSKDSIWEYIFILDFDEHITKAHEVIEKVKDQAIWMKILGSYPRCPRLIE
jgi:chorismate mutase/prephenate dehydratase